MSESQHRIVVTGLGLVTSIGIGRERFWENLIAGREGISEVESFDTSRFKVSRGGEVKDFDAEPFVQQPELVPRATQFAIAATHLALRDAALETSEERTDWGVAIGTTSGEPGEIETFNDRLLEAGLSPPGSRFYARFPSHRMAVETALALAIGGETTTLPAACAAGNYAIAHAVESIRARRSRVMLAGGSDAFSRITYSGFARLGAIAPQRCQPFDRDRRGMIPAEGAAMLVLEPLTAARQRGARIYAEVSGYGQTCDAHHMTGAHPAGDGAVRAMKEALASAHLAAAHIDYISAHGTGTLHNDRIETAAVKEVFGAHAKQTPMSSIKSMLGHSMGAASAIEAAAAALTISEGIIPPTINLRQADPECDLDYVANRSRTSDVDVVMSNAYAFGGTNASLILSRV